MKTIKIPTNDETLKKVVSAMETISKPTDRAEISLSYSELRFLKRLILTEEASHTLLFESIDEHIAFSKKQKESDSNASDS